MIDGLMDQQVSDLSTRIKTARKAARLSQLTLGNSIGLSDKSISAYEQGRSAPPFSKLKQIAQITNQPLSYFTDNHIDDSSISNMLLSIEKELNEIKSLLNKAKSK